MDTLRKGLHVRFPPNSTLRQSLSPHGPGAPLFTPGTVYAGFPSLDYVLAFQLQLLEGSLRPPLTIRGFHHAGLMAMLFASTKNRSPWHPPSELASWVEL